jgi:hypothetical protein
MRLLFLSYSPLLIPCGVLKARMHCLFIGKHPCKRQEAPIGVASSIKLVPNIVDFGSTNCCLAGFTFSYLKTFDDLIKSSPLIICDFSIISILVIFMLLTFLLSYKMICTIRTCQCWLVWSKHLLGFSLCEHSPLPNVKPARQQLGTNSMPVATPIGSSCLLHGCLPINRQCIQALSTPQEIRRGE